MLSRRGVLIGAAGIAGGGLVINLAGEDPERRRISSGDDIFEPSAFLQIGSDGAIVLQVDKVELGQGVMTGYVTLAAEELDVEPAMITPRHAPVHPLFQDPTQVTGESKTMILRFEKVREAAAIAREMLLQAAAARWDIPRDAVDSAGDGTVVRRDSGERLAYGDLAAAAARRDSPRRVALKPREAFRHVGTSVARPDIPAKVTGAAGYGIDVRLPGMLTAVIVRCPDIGGSLTGFDAAPALALAGVTSVFEVPAGIAVVARDFWSARQGAAALRAEWAPAANPPDDAGIIAAQRARLDGGDTLMPRDDGDAPAALSAAADVLEAEYTTPYLAHATMEPMNATVWLRDGECDIWAGCQAPDLAREVACQLTGLPRAAVRVNVPFIGGGFGRRALNDFVAEAVGVALRMEGDAPLRLVWTREDDMRHGYFRQRTLHRVSAGLDAAGRPLAWHHRLVAGNLNRHVLPPALATIAPEWLPDGMVASAANGFAGLFARIFGPFQARDGAITMPYAMDNVRVELADYDAGVPHAIWRSVGNSYNAFVVETMLDEIAHASGRDPAALRRELLAGQPRRLAVLERVLADAGWGAPPPGRHQGVAVHEAFGSAVAQVAEVSVAGNDIRVHRVFCAVDCGLAVNPDIVAQQMESGVIFGLTAALHGEIHVDAGRVRESNFHDYRMLRLADAPDITVSIVDTGADIGGVGEPGTPPVAPAVGNAVFAATGRRLRDLPLRL